MSAAVINNTALSAFNGSVLILASYCGIFVAIHLWQVGERESVPWKQWFFRLPIGMQIAVGFLTVCGGEITTRTAIWIWRYWLAGQPEALAGVGPMLGLGYLILSVGFLCVLRVVTWPLGMWPTAVAIGSVLAYLATFL